ncbi:MAG TPA: efflux RND transporter periplasmic adaptor subunit, partial [Caulobacteraceae bacterium]|nr:efflux RND transporter periplasmic adaptor subunit [Caulobacteraceae bacterium]
VDVGNQITANSATPVTVVTQIDPIDIVFAVPEDQIPAITAKAGVSGAGLPVTAYDRSGGKILAQGSLAAIDSFVDTATGTVKAKARFSNAGAALFPNQFVNVTVLVDTLKNQVTVPATAVRHGAQGDFVWVLQPDHTVKQRPVTVGPGTGETFSIAKGLALGETVITEGGDRLRDGGRVTLPGERQQFGGGGLGGRGGRHGGHRRGGASPGGS